VTVNEGTEDGDTAEEGEEGEREDVEDEEEEDEEEEEEEEESNRTESRNLRKTRRVVSDTRVKRWQRRQGQYSVVNSAKPSVTYSEVSLNQ